MHPRTAENLIDALEARSGMVAVVGAGGKKSTLYRLLEAHRVIGTRRMALTSTVQIAAAPSTHDLETLMIEAEPIDAAIAETRGRDGAWLITGPSAKPGRFSGLAEDLIPDIHKEGAFDLCLVKADGARMRMIKAPADNEPALPKGVSTILPIVSARVFGRSLTEKLVHRPERLTDIIDADIGAELTPDHVAKLLSSPDGSLKRVGHAKVIPVINMVESPERLKPARKAAWKALATTERFERVVLTSMTSNPPLIEVVGG